MSFSSALLSGGTIQPWWFSVLDVVGVQNDQDDYAKNRNYWEYLKTKLKKAECELVSVTNQLKLLALDGKKRLKDVLDNDGILLLAANFPDTKASRFVAWLTICMIFFYTLLYILSILAPCFPSETISDQC